MRISVWSSDVCSSDLPLDPAGEREQAGAERGGHARDERVETEDVDARPDGSVRALAEQGDEQRRQAEGFAAVVIDEREGEPGDGVDGIGRQRPVQEHRRHGEGRGGVAAGFAPQHRGRLVEMAQGLGCAPEKRSEEHTSELQSLMRSSYAVFCLKKNTNMKYT